MAATIEGKLDQLPTFVDLLRARKETGDLALNNGAETVHLYFQNGLVIHATDGASSGDETVYPALSWKGGDFVFAPGLVNTPRTIDDAQAAMLFETIAFLHEKGEEKTAAAAPPGPIAPARPKTQTAAGTLRSIAFPEGESLHEGLKLKFVSLLSLLDDLAQSNFSGYLMLTSGEREGLMLFHRGVVRNVYFYQQSNADLGSNAMNQILATASEREGEIGVRKLSEEFVASYASLLHGQAVHGRLDAKAVKIHGLIQSLQEDQFSGCVNIQMRDDATEGFVFFFNGQTLGGFYREGRLLVPGMGRVYQMVAEPGAMIWVFATPPPGEIPAVAVPRPATPANLQILLEASRRCVLALASLAGPTKMQGYFQSALKQVVKKHPWLSALKMNSDGTFIAVPDLTDVSLSQAIDGVLMLMNDCWNQGRALFGDKIVRANIQKQLLDIRKDLETLGFPQDWP